MRTDASENGGMKRFLGLLGREAPTGPAIFGAPLAPELPLAVIGDVHGCDSRLARLLDRIAAEAPEHQVIAVGDVVDRGEDSAGVLRRLAGRGDVLCLMGNHEAMLLEFLDEPERRGPRWLWNGGLQTLASFGVGGVVTSAGPEMLRDARDRLVDAMGEELIRWIRARPLGCRSGNVAVVHAGADPAHPLEDQDEDVLLWGHPDFMARPRSDGVWVVHGHTILPEPVAESGRIGVDTGAYATGRLTAALIGPGAVEFISA
jgi:serine/threonine protein phosphatase 1